MDPLFKDYSFCAKVKVRRLDIAPLCPARKAWKMVPALLQESLTVNTIERISEVHFHPYRGCVVAMPATPLSGSLQANLSAEWLPNSNLLGEKESTSLLLVLIAETLGCKPSPNFLHSYRTNAVVLFWQCCEVTTR